MHNKLFFLLKSFSKDDIKHFKKFISSPLNSSTRNYKPLLEEILRSINEEGNDIKSRKLKTNLNTEKNQSKQTLKNRLSELFKLAEEYVVLKMLNEKAFEKEKLLLQHYFEKRLYGLFETKFKKSGKKIESSPYNLNKFNDISFLKNIKLQLPDSRTGASVKHKHHYEKSLHTLCIFLIELFKDCFEFKLQEYNDRKIEVNMVEEIIKNLNIDIFLSNYSKTGSVIQKTACIYYLLYKAISEPGNDHHYFRMKKIFDGVCERFSNDFKEETYKNIINYCVYRQNEGNKEFQLELFKVYNERLKKGVYSEFRQNSYPVNSFRDYVLIGIELKKYKWVKNFIQKYSEELPEEIRSDEMNISYAKLSFAENKFDPALKYLEKIKGLNYLHYTDASVLRMCCYYEFNLIENSFYEIDKFKHYIRNHPEIPEIHVVPNLNFVNIYGKLISNVARTGKQDLGFLNKEIHALKFISKGKWLLEKIRQI